MTSGTRGPGEDAGDTTVPGEREAAELARLVAQRAIRRLDVLEWFIFLGGAVLATVLGGIVAWLLAGIVGWDFRTTWMAASGLLFVVPGILAIIKIKREEKSDAQRAEARRSERDA
ncbi:MAG: hypothetical protein R3253_06535 [Longimicrobiales bacterium]|nr:hypothetical protein [Longimicrobiales bacterium]